MRRTVIEEVTELRAKVKKIISYLEALAPSSLALPGDPVGLQLGNPETELNRVLVALDPDETAVEEALSKGAEMLVTHHPLFYHKISSIDESLPVGALVSSAIRRELSIFSAHTNFDLIPKGVSYQLACRLGLPAEDAEVLEVTGSEDYLKLVVFVPTGYEDDVRNALAGAGAGQIGRYSHCTFQAPGTGTYMPGEGTKPYIGSSGHLEKVDELRLETILPADQRKVVVKALLDVHPYEEVAYDLYPLALEGKAYGLGLVIDLTEPLSLDQVLQSCKGHLNAGNLRYWASSEKNYKRIALCGGSGGSLIEHAARQAADLFISGDFRYHDLKTAQALGIALIDAGHDATEWPGVAYLKQYLAEQLKKDNYKTEVFLQASVLSNWSQP